LTSWFDRFRQFLKLFSFFVIFDNDKELFVRETDIREGANFVALGIIKKGKSFDDDDEEDD